MDQTVLTLALSSSSSCSPSEASHYGLGSKRRKMTSGGHRESTPTIGSEGTSDAPVSGSSAGPSSKRARPREQVATHPAGKRPVSIEDCLLDLSRCVREICQSRRRGRSFSRQEMDIVADILKKDGISEGSELHARAMLLCEDPRKQATFKTYKTAAGRARWLELSWEVRGWNSAGKSGRK